MLLNRLSLKWGKSVAIALVCSVVLLAHCGHVPDTTATEPAKDSLRHLRHLTLRGDSLLIPAFSIRLQLSARANAVLTGKQETILVHAWFNGLPKDTTTREYRESGELFLGEKKIELDTAGTVTIDGVKFSVKQLDALVDDDVHVLVNVYSGRRAMPENILNCAIVDDKMSQLKGKTINLSCKLIAESDSLPIPPTPGYTPSGPPLSRPPLAPTK